MKYTIDNAAYFQGAAAALILYLVISSFLTYRRLRHFPGPFLASFSYASIFLFWFSRKQSASYKDLHKKYNSRLVRIGPNDLITDDPEMIKRMNSARSKYGRSDWYKPTKINPYEDALFNLMDVKEHDVLKAKLSFGYGGKENPDLEAGIDEQLSALVSLIRQKYITVGSALRPIEFGTTTQRFTLDVITRVAYGKAFGYLRPEEEDVYNYLQATNTGPLIPMLVLSGEIPWVGKLLYSKFFLNLIGPKPTDEKGIGKVLLAAEKLVSQRFESADLKDQQDMLASFIRHGVSRKQCEVEIPFQIIAGSDTTATAIRTTLLYLTTHQATYDRLRREIDDGISGGRISAPIKADEARKIPFLQAVIYEGMRMKIPFSGLVMKQVPPGGDMVDGMFIPEGTRIAHNTFALQRLTSIFGDDAEVFRPERWLEAPEEKVREMTQVVEMAFGYGRWMCAGKSVAFLELNKIFVELLRNFDFQILNPTHPWDEMNLNIFLHHNMWMKVTERNKS